jgi:hypothetical protein
MGDLNKSATAQLKAFRTDRYGRDALEIIATKNSLNGLVRLKVNGTRCLTQCQSGYLYGGTTDLIQNQNFRLAQQCTGKADELTLAG